MLTPEIMHQMWPHGDIKIPGLVEGIATTAPIVFPKYELTTDLVIAHAMAQFSHECGAGNEVVENLNYSADGLLGTWPSRFDAAKAQAFAHDLQKIANEVYNGRMGNRPGSEDGWNFRGRGGSQVTDREGYTKLGGRLALDLINDPDLVNHPDHFLECAVADFILCGCLPFALQDDVAGVTLHLNGGHIGLPQRTEWLARWKAIFHLNSSVPISHGAAWVQQSLNKLGAEPPLSVDGSFGPLTVSALRAFQRAHSLDADGRLSPPTEAALQKALAPS
jgi:putative chitinase